MLEVQQHLLRGPQRSRVFEHGSTDREKTGLRRGLQLRPDGHPGRGAAKTRGRRWPGASCPSRPGRRSGRRRNDSGGGGGTPD